MLEQWSLKSKLFLISPLLALCLLGTRAEAKMVSVARDVVNLRTGPSTNYSVKWVLTKGFPLKVITSKGKWQKVRDFENDEGWIYKSLTNRKAHVVVKKKVVNIRSGPGTKYGIIVQAKHGVVFRTLKRTKGWLKVKHEKGITGWVARRLVWGW